AGGIGAVHMMVHRLGLEDRINEALPLFKVNLPYHESDHVLNIAYNILAGGTKLEDIECLRRELRPMTSSGRSSLIVSS
ncbi:MAG: hypothetical protein KJ831_09105, partial [Candidatus Eisenbacteria bacterium]|nr:hypothetical protein [Candidatus Eisenbacteria bacterium]